MISGTRLKSILGLRSETAGLLIPAIYAEAEQSSPALAAWREVFSPLNMISERIPRRESAWADSHGISSDRLQPDLFLFSLQTYYAAVLKCLVSRVAKSSSAAVFHSLFDWPTISLKRIASVLVDETDFSPLSEHEDSLRPLYESLFCREFRHRLGEYYTPDWLVEHVLDQIDFTAQPGFRLLDPACGSGAFLIAAICRLKKPRLKSLSAPDITNRIVGIDVNPLAVIAAKTNYLLHVADLAGDKEAIDPPVIWGDSILGRFADSSSPSVPALQEPFDFVVGNPPWIAWDNLQTEYREATKPLWEKYGLFSLSGTDARHGGGKKDLSMLMTYVAADRYLRSGGRLGFVVTQTSLQSKGAGDGFRRFQLGEKGESLQILRADDFVETKPFPGTTNWTAAIFLRKGAETRYPIPYFRWKTSESCDVEECLASPIDSNRKTSPWRASAVGSSIVSLGPSDYDAHLGANSGGANAVYWLEFLEMTAAGARVRNVTAKSKREIPQVEAVIEPDLLYPLLQWGDVARFSAVSRRYILLTQDCFRRVGVELRTLMTKYPLTYSFLERFREQLESRSAFRRFQSRQPFYSMYNVGAYTLAAHKIIWRRMDKEITAAVASAIETPWGIRPVVPQETCAFVACDSSAEAHYLCATLNAKSTNRIAQDHQVRGGKGFGSPNVLHSLGIRRFDADSSTHRRLVDLSELEHANSAENSSSESVLSEIDELVESLRKTRR